MNERIQEIRDRKSEVVDFAMPGSTYEQLGSDIDYLLSEVERLQDENERLSNEMDSMLIVIEDKDPHAASKYWDAQLKRLAKESNEQ